jgi:hypothetical protein
MIKLGFTAMNQETYRFKAPPKGTLLHPLDQIFQENSSQKKQRNVKENSTAIALQLGAHFTIEEVSPVVSSTNSVRNITLLRFILTNKQNIFIVSST